MKKNEDISNLFLNPDYRPEDRVILTSLLKPLLLLFLFISFILFILSLVFKWKIGGVTSGLSSVCLYIAFVAYLKNNTNIASLITVYTLLAGIILNVFFRGGIYSATVFMFPAAISLGSILLKRKVYIISLIVSVVLFIGASAGSCYYSPSLPVEKDIPGDIIVTLLLLITIFVVINPFTNMLYRSFRAAKENEEKFKVLTEKLKVGIYAYSSNGKFIYVNEFMEELLGYSRDELLSMEYTDFIYPEDRAIVQERAVKRLAGENVINGYEFRALRKDGTPLWIFLSASKVNISDKDLGVGALFNIQQRKNLETEILAEKEQLAVTLRSIDDGVLVIDRNGTVTLINRAAEDFFECSQDKGAGKHINEFFFSLEISGVLLQDTFSWIKEQLEAGNRTFEGKIRTEKDCEKLLSLSISSLKNNRSEEIGEVIVFKDITKEKKIAKNAERMEKLEALGLLAGGIAHDFNNILTGILGNIDLLNLYLKDTSDDRVKKRLEDARKASSRAAGLTRQLLTFSKGGAPVKEVISLPHLVKDTIAFILSGSNITYHIDYAKDLWLTNADYGQLAQVVQNLAMNSKQAMEDDGGEVSVMMRNFSHTSSLLLSGINIPAGRYVEIVFQDNGPGIDSSVLAKIFDPYFTTKKTGNGLGLATVYSVVRQHDGYICVESSAAKGTTFSIYLPAADKAADEKFLENIRIDNSNSRSENKRILIMDDEEIVLSVSGGMLSELGYDPVTVSNGKECIEIYRKYLTDNRTFSAVFLDLTIPGGMGGKETAAEILKISPDACLIATSGYSNDAVMAHFEKYGFSANLKKPFLIQEIDECLKKLNC